MLFTVFPSWASLPVSRTSEEGRVRNTLTGNFAALEIETCFLSSVITEIIFQFQEQCYLEGHFLHRPHPLVLRVGSGSFHSFRGAVQAQTGGRSPDGSQWGWRRRTGPLGCGAGDMETSLLLSESCDNALLQTSQCFKKKRVLRGESREA